MTFTNQFDFSVDPLTKVDVPKEQNKEQNKEQKPDSIKRSSFTTPLSQASMLRSPSVSRRKSSVESRRASLSNIPMPKPDFPIKTQEQLINQFEKEQDSIVMRLTKEIVGLREENRALKHMLSRSPSGEKPPSIESKKPLSRTSSLRSPTSRRGSYGFGSHQSSITSISSRSSGESEFPLMKRYTLTPKDPSHVSVADIKAELDSKKETLRGKSTSPKSVSHAQVAI